MFLKDACLCHNVYIYRLSPRLRPHLHLHLDLHLPAISFETRECPLLELQRESSSTFRTSLLLASYRSCVFFPLAETTFPSITHPFPLRKTTLEKPSQSSAMSHPNLLKQENQLVRLETGRRSRLLPSISLANFHKCSNAASGAGHIAQNPLVNTPRCSRLGTTAPLPSTLQSRMYVPTFANSTHSLKKHQAK